MGPVENKGRRSVCGWGGGWGRVCGDGWAVRVGVSVCFGRLMFRERGRGFDFGMHDKSDGGDAIRNLPPKAAGACRGI